MSNYPNFTKETPVCEKCPLKIAEEYNNMKKNIELDFINYTAKWFEEHPYVDTLFVKETGGYCTNSMFLHSAKNVSCEVTLKC